MEQNFDSLSWEQEPRPFQINKLWIPDPNKLPTAARKVLYWLNCGAMVNFLQKLTGVQDLITDNENEGGGVHCHLNGGLLGIHRDFNYHPKLKLHRRVNVLLFLNKDWIDSWGGQLELWSRDRQQCVKRIVPAFNRMVCFSITDDAYHGAPIPVACPSDRKRFSLATYYYTTDRPAEELNPPHMSEFF